MHTEHLPAPETLQAIATQIGRKMDKRIKAKYPTEEGWRHLKITVEAGVEIRMAAALAWIGLTEQTAEVAYFWQGKRVVTLVARRKREPEKEVQP